MDESPFPYQGPLDPEQVRGRGDLGQDLIERLTEHRVTALLGPRRFGKTSLLRKVAADLAEVTTVWVDLYEVTSIADVAIRFDDALGRATGDFMDEARAIAASFQLSLGLAKAEFTKPPKDRAAPDMLLRSVLDVLVRTAARHPTLLVVDEFSSIAKVEGAAGMLRTALQHHFRELGIVFAGSHVSMMRALFTRRAEPFFAQADLVEIEALSLAAVEEIVSKGFASTGRKAGNVAGLVYQFTAGHPQRTMQLADACWRRTPPGATAGGGEWFEAISDVRRAEAEGMERLYSHFQAGEQAVLRAVAHTGAVYGARAHLLDLSKGTATHARDSLLDSGDLVRSGPRLSIVDPLLADWVRNRFPI